MSDRIKGFTVALTYNVRDEEEISRITSMIMMIKGVEGVEPVTLDPSEVITAMRIKTALREKLYKVIDEL